MVRSALILSLAALSILACDSRPRSRSVGTPPGTTPRDAGPFVPGRDAGPAVDAGFVDAGFTDAGTPRDAGRNTPRDGGDGMIRDAGTRDGGEAPSPGACPSYVGYDRVGKEWTIASNAAYEAMNEASWTSTSEILSIQDNGTHSIVQARYVQTITAATYSSTTNGTITYRCDSAGMSIVEQSMLTNTVTSAGTTTSDIDVTYAPPLLFVVPNPQVGRSFSASSMQTTSGVSAGQPFMNSSTIQHTTTFVTPRTITVPAGTFSNTVGLSVNWGTSQNTSWYEDNLGLIADDTSELRSYR